MKNYILPLLIFIAFFSYSNAQTVTIGSQIWTTKNLDVSTFRNGDPIPEVKTQDEWKKAAQEGRPAWCHYEYKKKYGKKYGKIYNYFAVQDPRGLSPLGWHIPSNDEWQVLRDFLGGAEECVSKLKSNKGWEDGLNGNNESGFDGLPGGESDSDNRFKHIKKKFGWWSSGNQVCFSLNEFLNFNTADVYGFPMDFTANGEKKDIRSPGFYVRCLRD